MPLSYLSLPPKLKTELGDHAEWVAPKEAVGLVLDDGSTLPLRNWARGDTHFLVGFWSILWHLGWNALRHGDGISMIYHSHPQGHGTQPSYVDKTFMAMTATRWPGVNHLIYVPGDEYSIWQYDG